MAPEAAAEAAPEVGSVGLRSFTWDGSAWVASSSEASSAAPTDCSELRLATMNILADCFPCWVRLAIASEERFDALCKEVEALDATVLAMNEVTANSLEMLLSSSFVRRHYYVTELPENCNGTIQPHGCVILSKLPFIECRKVDLDVRGGRVPVVGVFAVDGRRVAVCSLHTTAQQTPKNRAIRETQIARADCFLRSLNVDAHYIIGDLNLHYICEDGVVPKNSLLDLWAETHLGEQGDKDLGFTFDARSNAMICRYIPAERRQMRLDRMLCSKGAFLTPEAPVRLWGDGAIDERRELFLSDHYGLVVDLRSTQDALQGDPVVTELLRKNGEAEMEESGFSVLRFAAALTNHVPWLTLRAVGVW